ncbi:hypothetical protein Scep_007798 [Stephania cephalantha]|uniref:Uncharacterized protein n=1 Tax=Stephania cephalantha TaxID=152367 RepID=A0AAP0KAK0_9MAGN
MCSSCCSFVTGELRSFVFGFWIYGDMADVDAERGSASCSDQLTGIDEWTTAAKRRRRQMMRIGGGWRPRTVFRARSSTSAMMTVTNEEWMERVLSCV